MIHRALIAATGQGGGQLTSRFSGTKKLLHGFNCGVDCLGVCVCGVEWSPNVMAVGAD